MKTKIKAVWAALCSTVKGWWQAMKDTQRIADEIHIARQKAERGQFKPTSEPPEPWPRDSKRQRPWKQPNTHQPYSGGVPMDDLKEELQKRSTGEQRFNAPDHLPLPTITPTRWDFYVVHAPAQPWPFFKPVMAGPRPPCKWMGTEEYAGQEFKTNTDAVRACGEDRFENVNDKAQREWDHQYKIQKTIQWPAFYAMTMLETMPVNQVKAYGEMTDGRADL